MAYKFDTEVVHAGRIEDAQFGSLATPLYQTSTFVFDSAQQGGERFAGEADGYIYTRLGNPTTRQLEQKLAVLEGTEDAAATASGMAAVSGAIMANVAAGDHIIASRALYGCSFALLNHMLPKYGVEVSFVDMTDPKALAEAVQPNTKVVFLESPINPNLEVIDLAMVGGFARRHGLIAICDNTFLTPALQRPVRFGFDIVVHSATKYLNGHGDVIAGIICGAKDMIQHIKMTALKDIGGTMSPHDAWLILRGLKTLHLRMERHCSNAQKVAEFLHQHPSVSEVYYPGLPQHPGFSFIGSQMQAGGGVIAFELKGDIHAGQAMINATRLFKIAVSLGDAESLIQHPASMTHSPYSAEERRAAGISDTLIRLSVGLEHVDDIIADLAQALHQCQQQNDAPAVADTSHPMFC